MAVPLVPLAAALPMTHKPRVFYIELHQMPQVPGNGRRNIM
jgi:hypothetical protein